MNGRQFVVACYVFGSGLARAATAQSPTPAQVVAAHAAAIGEKALLSHTSLQRQGTIEDKQSGQRGSYRTIRRAPNQVGNFRDMGGVSTGSGFNGEIAWGLRGTSARLLDGDDRAGLEADAGIKPMLRAHTVAEYTGPVTRTTTEGCDCWRLTATTAQGKHRVDFYDAKSGLYRGTLDTVSTLLVKRERLYWIDSYGTYQGVQLPEKFRQRVGTVELHMTAVRTVFDGPMPSNFPTPPEVQALTKDR